MEDRQGLPGHLMGRRDRAVSHISTSPNLVTNLGGNAGKKFHDSNVITPEGYPVGPDRPVVIPNLVHRRLDSLRFKEGYPKSLRHRLVEG